MDSFNSTGEVFWSWLQKQNGVFLSRKIALDDYRSTNQGRGLIAKENISKDELLFTIPQSTVLSPQTSTLKNHLPGLESLDEWMSLILVMLYENQNPTSGWKAYFDVLPTKFDTPMFWNEEELAQLKGTEVLPRIGKQKSEQQYSQILLPLIKANPSLFNLEKCGIDAFHRMGSLVLAYSFGRTDEEEEGSMTEDITMVPLADMLNANPELNNARLFQASTGWEMRSIRPIPKNEQIYNTYGNLPNADLLRRYGYIIPGSRDDLVEISTEIIIEVVSSYNEEEIRRRIDILDEEDIFEEAFEIPFSGKIPEEMYVFCLAMMADTLDTTAIPEVHRTAELKAAIINILNKRMSMYDSSTEEDEELLRKELSLRERMAVEVRLGEKRILKKAIDRVDAWVVAPPSKRMKTH